MFPLFQTLQMASMSSSLRPTWRQRAKRPKRPQTPTSRCWKGWPRPSTRGTRASPLWSTCHSRARAKAPTTPSCTVWAAMCRTSHLCGNCHGNCTCGHSTWAYIGTGKMITFAFQCMDMGHGSWDTIYKVDWNLGLHLLVSKIL